MSHDPEAPATPPPAAGKWPRWRRGLERAGWAALAALCIVTAWFTFRPAPTTFHLSAVTEEVWIHTPRVTKTDSSAEGTSAISFGRVLLAEGDARIPLDSTNVRLSLGATIRMQRMIPETLVIILDVPRSTGPAGTVHRDTGYVRTLGSHARFLVPLRGEGADASFLLPFRAWRLVAGDVPNFSTGQRTALLRSGEIRLVARTRPKLDFEAGSYTLRTGQQVDLPAPRYRAQEAGRGLVLVEDGPGMTLNFTMRARRARVSSDKSPELLATGVFDRARHDPVIALAWVLVVTLVLGPLGSVIADRMKTRAESLLERS